jgi:hypothetical protein
LSVPRTRTAWSPPTVSVRKTLRLLTDAFARNDEGGVAEPPPPGVEDGEGAGPSPVPVDVGDGVGVVAGTVPLWLTYTTPCIVACTSQ